MSVSKVKMIRIAGIDRCSVVNGTGVRYTIFMQGCSHGCTGCHNPQTHRFDGGEEREIDAIVDDVLLYSIGTPKVTVSGGDPFESLCALSDLVFALTDRGIHDIWVYTGFTWEVLTSNRSALMEEVLKRISVLVDGPYIQELSSLECTFRGSTNQRLIDVQATILNDYKVVEYKI